MATWYAVTNTEIPDAAESARRERVLGAWAEAPFENLEVLSMLLEVAREDVIAYAPAPVAPQNWETEPPTRFVLAQLRQTQNLWDAGTVTGEGNVGEGGFTFTPRPLDKTIKKMIRPVDGKPHVL